MSVQLSVSYPK